MELQQQQYNEIDYKYGYLNPPQSTLKPFYHHDNDSNSTLSGASIDSWMKKRQDYDKRRLRNSYLASNDTLNMVDDEDSNSNSGSSNYNDYSRCDGEIRDEEKDLGEGKPLNWCYLNLVDLNFFRKGIFFYQKSTTDSSWESKEITVHTIDKLRAFNSRKSQT